MAFDVSSVGEPIDERYPEDLAAEAVAAMQAAAPDWVPRNASPEMIFIEAVMLAVADVVNTANDTIAAVEEDILSNFYQVTRSPGSVAGGEITVTFDSTVSTTIPAGTGFALTDYGVEVATSADVSVVSDTEAVLDVFTTEATTLVNGVGAGAALDVLDVIPNVLSVAVTGTFAGGAAEEDDAAYTARARTRLERVTNSLVVADHFSAYVLEDGRASNALCIPAWDGAAVGTIGSDAGYVTVVVYGWGGAVSAGDKTDLEDAMAAITYAGATVHVIDATVVDVDVTCTVKAMTGYTAAEAQAAAEDAIAAFLDPQTWTIGDDVVVGELQARIIDTEAVDYIDSMTDPSGTTTLDEDEVPQPGTVTVSVI
ncbi:MAG: baseplate J/gp47 family protein [Candidatus Nanopelagicales bacterium]